MTENKRTRFRRWFLLGGIPALAALGLLFSQRAHAFGPWCGHHGHHEPRSVDAVREHMSKRLDFLLDKVDATEAQRTKAEAVVDAAAPQLFDLMKQGRVVRGAIKDALLAEKLDKERIAKAQGDVDALADRASEIAISAMAQLAEVLTAAQRKEIAEELAHLHPGA